MKTLAQLEYLCKQHPHSPEADCAGCNFLARTERNAEQLRKHRTEMFQAIKRELKAGTIVIADFK